MTTDPQAIKARLAEVAADARYAYGVAIEAITELQDELADYKQAPGVRAEHYRKKAIKAEAERDEHYAARVSLQDRVAELLAERDERAATTPRVITADELREGQAVTIELNGGWFAGNVTGFNRVISNGCESTGPAKGLTDCTIVLLEDAPTSDDDDYRDAVVTAETIRASEPGSTWRDRDGDILEWTGETLSLQKREGGLGNEIDFSEENFFDGISPLTRSTAAPRGDYGKAELPTEPGKGALDYADEWRELYKKDPEAASKFLADAVGRLILPAKVVTDE